MAELENTVAEVAKVFQQIIVVRVDEFSVVPGELVLVRLEDELSWDEYLPPAELGVAGFRAPRK